MTQFSVWAPDADRVELHLGPRASGARRSLSAGGDVATWPYRAGESAGVLPMERVGEWWYRDVPDAGAGTRYRFSMNGAAPMPDPRSAFQPEGVHGPSEVIDHGAFEWSDQSWRGVHLPSAVVYELHIGAFTPDGTFDAAIERLDHLVDLGVNAIELMPAVEFPGRRGWGYDGVDLFAPHHAYGGPDSLKRLIDTAHRKGIGVIIDVVYNHAGPDGNYLGEYGPYFTDKYRTPWGAAVNFDDRGSDGVREFVVDNARMWLRDYHADGLRLDAVHAVFDMSATHILEQITEAVWALGVQLGRKLWVIAESDLNDPRLVRARDAGGYGIDAQWNDEFHHALHSVLTGESNGLYAEYGSIDDIVKVLNDTFVHDGRYSPSRGRTHGRPVASVPSWQFLGFVQNHDQIGNRATGERLAALVNEERVKVAAAVVLLSPFVPMLFMGEEWGASTPFLYFTDHTDEQLGRAVSEGRQREFATFGWKPGDIPDPQDESTFLDSKLNWDEVSHPAHHALLEWHRALIHLRRTEPDLGASRDGLEAHVDGGSVLVMSRGSLKVLANLGQGAFVVSGLKEASVLLASADDVRLEDGVMTLPPDCVAVVRDG